jgi:transcriptional regulator with XRE-family HTH domain
MSRYPRGEALSLVQQKIGTRIRWVQEIYNPNAAAVARELGMDPSTLIKIMTGNRPPNVFNVLDMCRLFGVSADFLLRGKLVAETDMTMAIRLAALHPELVLSPNLETEVAAGG